MHWLSWIKEIDISGGIDIVVMTLLIYSVLVWFKKTRAAFVLTGIAIMAGVYLLACQFNLILTAAVFQSFFTVILVATVVIFQEELRHFFEQVAVWSLNRHLSKRERLHLGPPEQEILVRTLSDLAREKIGALIVLRGKDMILRHLDGGVELNGKLSEEILKSIFDPTSIGHDGALVIERGQITRFGCHLPLSKNLERLGHHGTRHAAALGLSELTDALCLVVSEEQGTISVMRNGELRAVEELAQLSLILEEFYEDVFPVPESKPGLSFFKKNSREKVVALGMALALWFVLGYGSKLVYKSFSVPVEYAELPSNLVVRTIDPAEVEATFSGPRRAFYFLNRDQIQLYLKMWDVKEGTRTIRIAASDFSFPKNLILGNIEPTRVRVRIAEEKKEVGKKK